jgi:hypothetical protein
MRSAAGLSLKVLLEVRAGDFLALSAVSAAFLCVLCGFSVSLQTRLSAVGDGERLNQLTGW